MKRSTVATERHNPNVAGTVANKYRPLAGLGELYSRECRLSTPATVTATAILRHTSKGRPVAFLLVATIAAETRLSPRSVRRGLRELEAEGYLLTQHVQARSSTYRLRFGMPAEGGQSDRHNRHLSADTVAGHPATVAAISGNSNRGGDFPKKIATPLPSARVRVRDDDSGCGPSSSLRSTTGKKKEARATKRRRDAGHSEIDPPHTAVAKQSAGEGGKRERSKELQDDQYHCFGTPRDGDGGTVTGSGAGVAKPDKDIRDAALRYRDDIMRKAEEAEDAERERFVVERAANPSRCLCGFADTPEAPMSGHLRGNPDREQHRVVLPLREVKAT